MTKLPTPYRYFSGDWEFNEAAGAYMFAFEAEEAPAGLPDGFICPVVTATVLEAVALRQSLLQIAEPTMEFARVEDQHDGRWLAVLTDDCGEVYLEPDSRGLYDLTPLGICWSGVDEDDNVITRIRSTRAPF